MAKSAAEKLVNRILNSIERAKDNGVDPVFADGLSNAIDNFVFNALPYEDQEDEGNG